MPTKLMKASECPFHGIARGREEGVWLEAWRPTEHLVEGYSNKCHKGFMTKQDAIKWLKKKGFKNPRKLTAAEAFAKPGFVRGKGKNKTKNLAVKVKTEASSSEDEAEVLSCEDEAEASSSGDEVEVLSSEDEVEALSPAVKTEPSSPVVKTEPSSPAVKTEPSSPMIKGTASQVKPKTEPSHDSGLFDMATALQALVNSIETPKNTTRPSPKATPKRKKTDSLPVDHRSPNPSPRTPSTTDRKKSTGPLSTKSTPRGVVRPKTEDDQEDSPPPKKSKILDTPDDTEIKHYLPDEIPKFAGDFRKAVGDFETIDITVVGVGKGKGGSRPSPYSATSSKMTDWPSCYRASRDILGHYPKLKVEIRQGRKKSEL